MIMRIQMWMVCNGYSWDTDTLNNSCISFVPMVLENLAKVGELRWSWKVQNFVGGHVC